MDGSDVDFEVVAIKVLEAEPRAHSKDDVLMAFEVVRPACELVDQARAGRASGVWNEQTQIRLAMAGLLPDGFAGSFSETLGDVRVMFDRVMTRLDVRPNPCFSNLAKRVNAQAALLAPVLGDGVEDVPMAVRDCARGMRLAQEVMAAGCARKVLKEPVVLTPVMSEMSVAEAVGVVVAPSPVVNVGGARVSFTFGS